MFRNAPHDPEQTKPFLAHLEDLRRTLIGSAGALVIGLLIAIPLAPLILGLAKLPLARIGVNPDEFLRVFRVAGGISIAMRLVFWSGVLFSAPFVVLFVGNFVFPGLTQRERHVVARASGAAVALFAGGAALAYFLILPFSLRMMFRINDWLGVSAPFFELDDYADFVLKLLLTFGLAFEYPVVLVSLGRLGILSADTLRAKRRHVAVLILILSAVVTPTVDPFTQIVVALPLYLLYEACIWLTPAQRPEPS